MPQQIRETASNSRLAVLLAVLFSGGVMLAPTPEGMTIEAQRLLGVTILMAVCWIMQPIPIAVTSLIPMAAYPLCGIAEAKDACRAYADHNVFLFLGGFVIALAIERCGLHKRIALHIVSRVGSRPKQIVFGFMLTTALLSMWISNTASTMLMLPIALALLLTLRDAARATGDEDDDGTIERMTVPLLLGIAYAASCGGLSTFVGTPTNVSLRGFWERQFVSQGHANLSMAEWMATFVPLSVGMLASAGLVMTWGLKSFPNSDRLSRSFFRDRLHALGQASPTERRVFVVFISTAVLWILRKPLRFDDLVLLPDWPSLIVWIIAQFQIDASYLLKTVQDSTIAIGMAILLFLIPGETSQNGEKTRLMNWVEAEPVLPWGMLLLIGSGFAMADAFKETALSDWLGTVFANAFSGQPVLVLVLGICLLVTFLTEFTTNVATVNTLLPTLAAMSGQLQIDPRLLLIPATVSASCAFMLPIATPPNAIVFGSGKVPMTSMIRYGAILNVMGALLTTATIILLGPRIMGISL